MGGPSTKVDGGSVCVQPICATCWDGLDYIWLDDLCSTATHALLHTTATAGGTIWMEASLEGLEDPYREWFEGSFDVWESIPNPRVDWTSMDSVLEKIGLQAPALGNSENEKAPTQFLRAIPYVYTRGLFGTIRDALSDDEVAKRMGRHSRVDGRLTAFPAIGFHAPADTGLSPDSYVAIRSVVAVVRQLVLTVRLPNLICEPGLEPRPASASHSLEVPKRFFPLRRMPGAREVAEAIGLHQATTARAIANKMRRDLQDAERTARKLNPADPTTKRRRQPEQRLEAVGAGQRTDRMAEMAQRLDRQISQLLRRYGDRFDDAPKVARELVPAEVKGRYGFARDDVRQLQDDCRLASQVVRGEVSVYDDSQRESLQFIAALLASVVLLPTLIAGIFGVNLGVPGKKSTEGFFAFVVAIVLLGGVGYSALSKAREYHWSPPLAELRWQIAGAIGIMSGLGLVLWLVS